MPRLDDWYVQVVQIDDPFRAPETMPRVLVGTVTDHPRLKDGDQIRTSPIVGVTTTEHIVTQSGTLYELGTVRPGYEAYYPNARQRLLDSLMQAALAAMPVAETVHG